jgi:DNA-binding response OmpR family regulator
MIKAVKQSYKILVVDDDPSVSGMFKSLLEFDGHEVLTVDHPEVALAWLEQSKFDLVITDYLMRGMMGDEFAALVKQRWPDQPIIMASGSYSNSTVVGNRVLRVDYFLSKPFLMDELRDAIAWVLTNHADHPHGSPGTHWMPGTDPGKPDTTGRRPDDRCDL